MGTTSSSALCLLLAVAMLLGRRAHCSLSVQSDQKDPGPKDCNVQPLIAVGNGGAWVQTRALRTGEDLHATCPFGIIGPYVTCAGFEQWSDVKGGTACPGDANVCPQNLAGTEAPPGGAAACRCKAGFKRDIGSGFGPLLTCTACAANEYSLPGLATDACKPCPATTEPTPDKSACRCLVGRTPQLDTSWERGTLSCESCPAGYAAAAGGLQCLPCRGYYEYSAAGAAACATCPDDSYANDQHTGCRCNKDCTVSSASGASLTCYCPVFDVLGQLVDCSIELNLEGSGSICQCKAGYKQTGIYASVPTPLECTIYTKAAGCNGPGQYSLAGTGCLTCPTNSVPLDTRDGCICKDGYALKAGTSSQDGTLVCEECAAGTYARAGDLACSGCPESRVSGAAASACILCARDFNVELLFRYRIQANGGKTNCECAKMVGPGVPSGVAVYPGYLCVTQRNGLLAYCSCAPLDPAQGRRLHGTYSGNASYPAAPESANDMEMLIATSTLQWGKAGSAEAGTQAQNVVMQQEQQLTLEPTHISPTLRVNGKPAAVLPMEVLSTTWEGRDATDVAACLSGALLTTSNLSLLAPLPVLERLGLPHDAAASMARDLLPQLWPELGSAAVFTSSMYKGGPRISAKKLKAALVQHYASLLPLPSCLRVPEGAAHKLRVAQSNVLGMTTGTVALRGGEVPDLHNELYAAAELAVKVMHVMNEKHPELCAGIEGSSFRLRLAGFGGHSSLSAATPNHIWVYAAVAEDVGLCGEAQ